MILKQNLFRDLVVCFLLFLFSAGVGLGVNALRKEPLPLRYEPPGAQFQKLENGESWLEGIHVIDVGVAKPLVEKKGALILDARPDLFHEFGHLPGAENLSRKNFDSDFERLESILLSAKEQDVPLVIYCAHEHCEDASKVAQSLVSKGFGTILIYEGGYDEWEGLGLKTEEGK